MEKRNSYKRKERNKDRERKGKCGVAEEPKGLTQHSECAGM
jgi:hypothetical protein